jgi:hypothetical protein
MKLAFKRRAFGFTVKDVPIELRIGTLEDTCKELDVEFNQISDTIKNNEVDFFTEFLYQGYITAMCEKLKRVGNAKVEYNRIQSILWYEYMSIEAKRELQKLMAELFGEIKNMSGKEVKKKVK